MRILHLMNGLEVGGRERLVLDLCERARAEGWQAELALFDTDFRSSRLDLDPGDTAVTFLPRRPGVDRRYAGRLADHLRDGRFDLLHAHNDTAAFYGGLALRKARGVAGVATFHTAPHASRAGRWATRWAMRGFGRLTVVSPELGERLRAEGWLRDALVTWNGVDLERFGAVKPGVREDRRASLRVPEGGRLIGHVGRYVPIKRHLDLVEAFALVRSDFPDSTLVLVGEGPTRDEVVARLQALGDRVPKPTVQFVRNTHDVPELLSALDLFVLPSDHECAPLALLEAMAAGVPCVATSVGSVPEIFGQDAGVLVPARDPRALAEAIGGLLADEARCRALAERGRERAADFSLDACWRRYADLYRTLTSRTSPGSPRAS